MSSFHSFILSTALGFVIYEVMAYWQPLRGTGRRIFTEEIGTRWAIFAQYVLLAFLVGMLLIVLMLFHNSIIHLFLPNLFSLDVNLSINVILGFFCGPLLGIWLNSIIRLPPKKGLSRPQIIGGIGLVIFVILGSAGDAGTKLIQKYSENISSVTLGGALGLQFTAKSEGGATPRAPAPPSAGDGTTKRAIVSSQGLQYIGHLASWFIEADNEYLKRFEPSNPALNDKFPSSKTFATDVIDVPFRCLSGWSKRHIEDSTSIEGHPQSFAEIFRHFHNLTYLRDNDKGRNDFVEKFMRQSEMLASDIKSLDDQSLVAPTAASTKSPPCKILLQWFDLASPPNIQTSKPNVDGDIKDISKDEFKERPYLAIALASIMAQLGQYPAAGATLEEWLRDAKNLTNSNSSKTDWLELRARSVLATYTEEWVERDEENVTTPLRDEHLNNLEILRQGIRTTLENATTPAKVKFFTDLLDNAAQKHSINFIVPRTNDCQFKDEQDDQNQQDSQYQKYNQHKEDGDVKFTWGFFWQYLFTLYVTTELTYDLNTLLHPDYNNVYADQTTDSLRALVNLDLSCALPY